nr:FkbM family methyltransferase [Mesorhizobium sp.]
MAELLRKDADLVDVGANIGWYSVVAGHYLGSRGEIHSFEPDKRNLELLRRNVALSSLTNVRVNAFALSDGDRSELLSLDADNLGDHRLGARDGYAFVHVNARALDGYAGIRRRPLVIKLDVQGSELDVLRGCSKLLRHHPEEIVLLCEICSMLDDRGARLDDLCELFIENGFVAAVLNQQTRSIRPEGWQSLRRRWGAMRLADAALAEDIVLFRRFDGLMKALLDCGLRKVEKT